MIRVRSATAQDLPAVVSVLAEAFADDPVVRWMQPDGRHRAALFTALARDLHAAPGATDLALIDDRPVGSSLWDPPGYRPSRWQTARPILTFGLALRSHLRYGPALEAAFAQRRPKGRHWYLAALGACTPGKGVGSALLQRRLDQVRSAAYLESSHLANVTLYQRFGFEVREEIQLPFDGPTVWTMYRPAPHART